MKRIMKATLAAALALSLLCGVSLAESGGFGGFGGAPAATPEPIHKSVIAFPENCQSCGQCFVNCYGRSLTIVNDMYGYAQTAYRAATTVPLNRFEQPVVERT